MSTWEDTGVRGKGRIKICEDMKGYRYMRTRDDMEEDISVSTQEDCGCRYMSTFEGYRCVGT